ncbi:unnamed protein product, partial [Polarella glacialis]
TGEALMPANSTLCFAGPYVGLNFSTMFVAASTGAGMSHFDVHRNLRKKRCHDVSFSQAGQSLNVDRSKLNECLPMQQEFSEDGHADLAPHATGVVEGISVADVRYCSDQNEILVQFAKPVPISVTFASTNCSRP